MKSRNVLLGVLLVSAGVLCVQLIPGRGQASVQSDVIGDIIPVAVDPPREAFVLQTLHEPARFEFPREDFLALLRSNTHGSGALAVAARIESLTSASNRAELSDVVSDARFSGTDAALRATIYALLDAGTVSVYDAERGRYLPAILKLSSRTPGIDQPWSHAFTLGEDVLLWEVQDVPRTAASPSK